MMGRLRLALAATVLLAPACRGGRAVDAAVSVAAADAARAPAATSAPVVLPEEPEPELGEVDAGPRAKVRLVLKVSPADAEVFWGARRLGVAKRGVPFEIERPEDSGPLDLTLRAAGYLPYHTRLFSERDDRVGIELVRPDQASTLIGWSPKKSESNRATGR